MLRTQKIKYLLKIDAKARVEVFFHEKLLESLTYCVFFVTFGVTLRTR